MLNKRVPLVVGIFIVGLFAVTACAGVSSPTSSSATVTSESTPGSVTPSGTVPVGGAWMMTVHSAQAYTNTWNAPAGMPGSWGHMGQGRMAVVFDISAQTSGTPAPSASASYAGPVCALRGGSGMMGPMMGDGYEHWQMMSPGLYRGPMAYMASTSTRQFTLVCTDRASGNQASWNISF